MQKLKISFVIYSPNSGGGAKITAKHARLLQDAGHEVTVTGLGITRPTLRQRFRALKKGGIAKHNTPDFSHFDREDIEVRTVNYAKKIMATDLPDADIVIATFWRTAEWVLDLPPEKGEKFYFVQGLEIHPQYPQNRVEATYLSSMQKITISNWIAQRIEQDYNKKCIAIAPNSTDFSVFNSPYRTRNNPPTIGYQYSNSYVKGTDVIHQALQTLKVQFPELKIVCFGAHEQADGLETPEGTVFHKAPSQQEIAKIYCNCDVWLSGSRSEGFGLTILEAMACRCPVVATRAGGPDDIIVDGRTGFLVASEDANMLAQKTAELLNMPEKSWEQISNAASIRALEFDWETSGQVFESALIKGLLKPNNLDAPKLNRTAE